MKTADCADITDEDEHGEQKKTQGPLVENQLRGKLKFFLQKETKTAKIFCNQVGSEFVLCFLRYLLLKKKRFGAPSGHALPVRCYPCDPW
jgi:hypothetical protein